jgi:hypothetical protein
MRDFKIFLNVGGDWVLVSPSLNKNHLFSSFKTFDESLEEKEKNHFKLKFSINSSIQTLNEETNTVMEQTNPLMHYYYIGAKMHVIIDEKERIDFVITSITPNSKNRSSTYTIQATDEVTFLWARHNVGYNYSTLGEDEETLFPKNIFDIAKDVLADNHLDHEWSVTTNSEDPDLINYNFILEVTNSNPYNVLIEACNTVNAYLKINYYTKRLDFIRKDMVPFSGYVYRPQTTIIDYSSDYAGEELTTMLHVSGGTDVNDSVVTIVPQMPYAVRALLEPWMDAYKECLNPENTNSYREEDYDNTWSYFKDKIAKESYLPYSFQFQYPKEVYKGEDNTTNLLEQNDATYVVKYNDKNSEYYGELTFLEQDGQNKNNIRYTIPIAKDVFSITKDDEGNDKQIIARTITCQPYTNGTPDDKINLTLVFPKKTILDASEKYLADQEAEVDQFFEVAQNNNYLGHSLIDFSYFKSFMSQEQWDELDNLINVQWRRLNIKKQYYSYEYYYALSELTNLRSAFITYAELYGAACKKYADYMNNDDGDNNSESKETEHINEIIRTYNDLRDVIENSNYFNLINKLGADLELEISSDDPYGFFFTQMIESRRNEIKKTEEHLAFILTSPDSSLALVNEQNFYLNRIKTLQTLCENFSFVLEVDDVKQFMPGAYNLIVNFIRNTKKDKGSFSNIGVGSVYRNIESRIRSEILRPLYQNYGQFILEQNYENQDELTSYDLYKQAIAHFADINRIKVTYKLDVLDIGQLEGVPIQRLFVGSLIKVLNKESIKTMPYLYILNLLKKYGALYNFYSSSDEPDANYELKDLATKISNAKEELVNKYKENTGVVGNITFEEIISEIFYDEIRVTGINRVLREPLKDSVTVEQPSRYKTILSKLIKSI